MQQQSLVHSPSITVVGSFAVDFTIRTPHMPIFGQTLFGSEFAMGPGGKGSNQAVGAARLGARASLAAMLGKDRLAEIATELYRQEGVGIAHLGRTAHESTGVALIILNEKGENLILLHRGANAQMNPAAVDAAEALIAQSDVLLSVLEIPLPAAWRALELGRKHGKKTILNPAPALALPDAIFECVDYLTPNESELRLLLGLAANDPRPAPVLAAELRKRGAKNVVVTLGAQGAWVLTDHQDVGVSPCAVDVVDTTGAGDAFHAGFAVALGEGRALIDAVRFGCACGALACSKLGVLAGLPTREDAQAMFRRHYGNFEDSLP